MKMWKRLVRLGFRLLYNEFAWAYDFVAWCASLGQWQAWGRTALSRLRGRRILELAHGPGHLLVALRREGYQPVGIDLSPAMSRQAARRLRQAGLHVPLVRCRAQAPPFRSGSFDAVVAAFPTDYIADGRTLREAARVTTSQGRLVIVAGAQLIGRGPVTRFVEWLHRVTGQREPVVEDPLSLFQDAGMSASIEVEAVGASRVGLVVADKGQAE